MTYLKEYMKTVKTHLKDSGKSEDDIKAFEKRAQGLAKKVLGNFKVRVKPIEMDQT